MGRRRLAVMIHRSARLTLMLMTVAFPTHSAGAATAASQARVARKGHTMHATGTFEVKMGTADPSEIGREAGIGHMTIDKLWSGDIKGSSKGEMLTGITAGTGSMAYAAVEQVTASVNGRSGSFYFLHRATMMKSDPSSAVLEVTVVPGSGTGDLAGLSGSLAIDTSGGGHRYDFTYELP